MELINRYVHQVGRHLPKGQRADVEAELRSLLLDALDERAEDGGESGVYTVETQVAVLTEFGRPEQMAERYQPRPRYVVGPKLYPIYRIIVGALALAGFVAALVTTTVSVLASEAVARELAGLIGKGINLWWNVFISGVGVVTLIMALLERSVPDLNLDLDEDEAWDPRTLPEIVVQDEISVASLIAEIVVMGVLVVLFAGFADKINVGAYYSHDGWHIVPGVLAEAFFTKYLPLMLARWALTILLDAVLLRQGRWQLGTRLGDLALHALDMAVIIWLLTGPPILNGEAVRQLLGGLDADQFSLLRRGFQVGFQIALWLGLVGTLIEVLKKVWRLLGGSKDVTTKLSPAR